MNRRPLLAPTAAAIALPGCSSWDDEGGETRLGSVAIMSHMRADSMVDVRIEWDGEIVDDSTHEIEPEGDEDDVLYDGVLLERTWPDEPGQFTIDARIAGDEWEAFDPATYDYPDCLAVEVWIHEGPSVGFAFGTDELVCERLPS